MRDLTNVVFNRLKVIKRASDYIKPNGYHIKRWECECECGNKGIIVNEYSLLSKNTKSCGCYKKETAIKNLNGFIKINENSYDLTGEQGIGYTSKGDEFYFDIEDYDKIKDYCWSKTKDDYIRAKVKGTEKHIFLHKIILNDFDDIFIIDHQNGIPYDCRKSNLRYADNSKNNMNKIKQKNNTSGITGITWHKRDSIWEAYISKNKKRIYLGRYRNLDDAIKIRKQAEEEYFGKWSYDNSRNHQ